jgi:hypothetical protein
MSRGPSGRIVVELDPALKNELYVALAVDGLTFKEWLLRQVDAYVHGRNQLRLFAAESASPTYRTASDTLKERP